MYHNPLVVERSIRMKEEAKTKIHKKLQNACMLNVILKETNGGSWITLWITERMEAVPKDNQEVILNGKGYKQKATRGWQFCIEWKDKLTSWERLSDMKESYPVEVAEYAEVMCISFERAFSW